MRSRIGYIIINLSYFLFALDIYLFNKIAEKYAYLCAICLVLTVFILFLGIYLVHPKKQMIMKNTNTKFDKVLQFIAVIPFVIILAVSFIILEIIAFIFFKEKSFIQKTKPLRKLGFEMKIIREDKCKVYYFKHDKLILKFVPNKIYDISFNGGIEYVSIVETNIGTYQEIEHLKNIQHQCETVDYRDKDLYDPTSEFVKFIIKNIAINKIND